MKDVEVNEITQKCRWIHPTTFHGGTSLSCDGFFKIGSASSIEEAMEIVKRYLARPN